MADGRLVELGFEKQTLAAGDLAVLDDGTLQVEAVNVENSAVGQVPLTITPKSGQTADILVVKNAAGAIVFSVRADGTLHGLTGGSVHFDL